MDDCYHADRRNAWVTVFGGAKYVFTARTLSAALYERAIDQLWQTYPVNLDGIERPTGADIKTRGSRTFVPGLDADLGDLCWRLARTLTG